MSLKKLNPMTMDDLRNLRDYTLEKKRFKTIDTLMRDVYYELIKSAEKSLDHFFYYDTTEWSSRFNRKDFILKNISDIINELSKVFPDCLIEVKNMIKSKNDEFIDISDLNNESLKLFDKSTHKLCIFIDYRKDEETY
jgi:hypothetical protein